MKERRSSKVWTACFYPPSFVIAFVKYFTSDFTFHWLAGRDKMRGGGELCIESVKSWKFFQKVYFSQLLSFSSLTPWLWEWRIVCHEHEKIWILKFYFNLKLHFNCHIVCMFSTQRHFKWVEHSQFSHFYSIWVIILCIQTSCHLSLVD